MALSNKFGYLVLTTGNKSEMATGYSTTLRRHGGGCRNQRRYQTLVYKLSGYLAASPR